MAAELSPIYAPFFGVMGSVSAIVFTSFGAAYGTAKAGSGVCAAAILKPEGIMKSVIPCVMAGIISIYGLVVAAIIANNLGPAGIENGYRLYTGFLHLGAGLAVGLSGLAGGIAIGVVGDAGIRGGAQQPRLFVGMILILIFAEVLSLYGLIVGLVLASRGG